MNARFLAVALALSVLAPTAAAAGARHRPSPGPLRQPRQQTVSALQREVERVQRKLTRRQVEQAPHRSPRFNGIYPGWRVTLLSHRGAV